MVAIREACAGFLEGVQWQTRVVVTRGEDRHDGVCVVRAPEKRSWTTSLAALRRPADLTRTLLKVWKMPDLTAWYLGSHGQGEPELPAPAAEVPAAEVPAAEVPGPAGSDDGDAVRAMLARKRDEWAAERAAGLPPTVGESMNGKHRRRPGGGA